MHVPVALLIETAPDLCSQESLCFREHLMCVDRHANSDPLILLKCFKKNACRHHTRTPDANDTLLFYSAAVQEVWKQQTLLQLLQLVEVPVLDCVLKSPSKPARLRVRLLKNHDLVISNTCVDREVSQILNLPESVSDTTNLTPSVHLKHH